MGRTRRSTSAVRAIVSWLVDEVSREALVAALDASRRDLDQLLTVMAKPDWQLPAHAARYGFLLSMFLDRPERTMALAAAAVDRLLGEKGITNPDG